MRLTVFGLLASVLLVSTAAAQTPKPKQHPKPADFTVAVNGSIVADFSARITAYAELRRTLKEGRPGLVVTANHNEIRRTGEVLARRIRWA